jgi:hypothetical protein
MIGIYTYVKNTSISSVKASVKRVMRAFLDTEVARQRVVARAIAVTTDTLLTPKRYELQLLKLYKMGELTIEAVTALLEASIYHIFYRSQATYFPTKEQLQDLLEWFRNYNAQHHLTGLILYSDGRFAQVLEGTEAEVRTLFTRIQQDLRHQHVFTISEGPGPQRWFADGQMALNQITPVEFDQMLQVVERGVPPVLPIENPQLQRLMEGFGPAGLGLAQSLP